MIKYCCPLMAEFIVDPRIPIDYIPYLREHIITSKKFSMAHIIYYCPWCGTKLPTSVREEYFEIFYDELHLTRADNLLKTPGLPEEFKTDEWWKKRGL